MTPGKSAPNYWVPRELPLYARYLKSLKRDSKPYGPIVERYVSSGRTVDSDLLTAVYQAFIGRDWESLKGGRE